MKISVITVAYNAEETIMDTIKSVATQSYSSIEHIIVDGASTDKTVDIIREYEGLVHAWISEPDKGIYDAMNKGITMATGDIIGFLNADDIYADSGVLSRVAELLKNKNIDACFADLNFINSQGKMVRRYSSSRFRPERLAYGWMPAHPTLYVRKLLFSKVGLFRIDYKIAADYEWIVRLFVTYKTSWCYVPDVWVHMRLGGVSTKGLRSRWVLNCEIVRACRENGIRTNIWKVLMKFPLKLMELFIQK